MAVDFKVRESIASKVTGTVSHSNVQERIFDVSRTPARDTIAVLRAVVCLSILCMHFFPAALAQWPGSAKQVPDPQWLVANVRFGFESFFVLAGYFLFHSFRADDTSHISVTAFLKRRLLRLAVPYWVALVIVGVCGYILSGLIRGKAPLAQFSDLPPTVFFVHDLIPVGTVSYALWFMAPLMQFYLLWSLIFWMVREFCKSLFSCLSSSRTESNVFSGRWGVRMLSAYGCIADPLRLEVSSKCTLPDTRRRQLLRLYACY
jgi:peptidoglycan/LPS O-acetylase OafA/YrhL